MKNHIYTKKKNDDGTDFIDPLTNDFVMLLMGSEEIVLYPDTDSFKKDFLSWIDNQTSNNIFLGLEFDGHVFSMSLNAQINWSNLLNIPEQLFPLSIMTKADEAYTLSFSDRNNFYFSAMEYKNSCLQQGNSRKINVNACTTLDQLKQLADNLTFPY